LAGPDMPRLLLVEDEPVNARIISRQLEGEGFAVEWAASGEDCLDRLDRPGIDLVLLDVMLPGISGMDVLTAVRSGRSSSDLPVIMVTSLEEAENVIAALELGANDYLKKPVNIRVAAARIRTHLEIARFHREEVRLRRLKAVASLVATYNHEILNPLSVATMGLDLARRDRDLARLDQVEEALGRIAALVKKIRATTSDDIRETDYLDGEQMLDLDRKGGEQG